MAFTEQESSKGFFQQPNMRPDPIQAADMSDGPSSDTSSIKKALTETTQADHDEEEDEHVLSSRLIAIRLIRGSGFVILDAPNEVSVVDVFLGEERKLVQLPARLARGLATLLLNAPERSTIYTPADDAVWQSLELDGWWKELIKTDCVRWR